MMRTIETRHARQNAEQKPAGSSIFFRKFLENQGERTGFGKKVLAGVAGAFIALVSSCGQKPASKELNLTLTRIRVSENAPMKVSDSGDCTKTRNVSGDLIYIPAKVRIPGADGEKGATGRAYLNPEKDEVYYQPSGVTQCYFSYKRPTYIEIIMTTGK